MEERTEDGEGLLRVQGTAKSPSPNMAPLATLASLALLPQPSLSHPAFKAHA